MTLLVISVDLYFLYKTDSYFQCFFIIFNQTIIRNEEKCFLLEEKEMERGKSTQHELHKTYSTFCRRLKQSKAKHKPRSKQA